MSAPKARRGFMPQRYNFEDDRVKVVTRLGGLRRILSQIPYQTGSEPKLTLVLHLKDPKFKVEVPLSIDCDAPKHREDSLYEYNYGWFTNDIKLDTKYDIVLPKLDRAGNYEYQVNVRMSYEYNGERYSINSIGKILSTGKVRWIEDITIAVLSIFISFLILLAGSGLTLLIQWITSKFIVGS